MESKYWKGFIYSGDERTLISHKGKHFDRLCKRCFMLNTPSKINIKCEKMSTTYENRCLADNIFIHCWWEIYIDIFGGQFCGGFFPNAREVYLAVFLLRCT